MKLIDAEELLKHEMPAKAYSPEMLVVGKGHVLSALEMGKEETWRADAAETQALERIRAAKKPTRRGILVCGQIMAEMLRIGWKKEQLDALEILFWSVRDGNGEVIQRSSANQ